MNWPPEERRKGAVYVEGFFGKNPWKVVSGCGGELHGGVKFGWRIKCCCVSRLHECFSFVVYV